MDVPEFRNMDSPAKMPEQFQAEQTFDGAASLKSAGDEQAEIHARELESDLDPRNIESGIPMRELNSLSEIERQSVTDSVDGLIEFAKRRLLSMAADHLAPPIGGRIVDLAFELQDVMTSVRALDSDHPVLEAPLPSPVTGIDFTLEIPLVRGEEANADPPLAVCIEPDMPSLTGGWALDTPEHAKRPDGGESGDRAEWPPDDAEEELERELEGALEWRRRDFRWRAAGDTSELRAANRFVTARVVEIDLGSLPLLRRRKLRAWQLYVLAREYSRELQENMHCGSFDILVIADSQRHCGLWIWIWLY
jgi:hypothetical protein